MRLNLRFKEIWKNFTVVLCGTEIEPRVWEGKVLSGFSPVFRGSVHALWMTLPPVHYAPAWQPPLPSFNRPSSFLLPGFSAGCFLFQECSLLPTHPPPFLKTNKTWPLPTIVCSEKKKFLDFPTQLALPGPTILIIHQHYFAFTSPIMSFTMCHYVFSRGITGLMPNSWLEYKIYVCFVWLPVLHA